ncbi:MAG: hypothetical protein ACREMK_10970 [Gemmatimonadota bacterium]
MRALIGTVVLSAIGLVAPLSAHAQADNVAIVSAAGVTIEVDPEAWRGEPARFDKVLPVLVRIENDGDTPLRIRYEDFALVTESGERVPATSPYDIEGTESVLIEDRYNAYDPYDFGYRYRLVRIGPYGRLAYIRVPYRSFDDFSRFRRVELPTSDMVSRALAEEVVEPGDRVTGFVYFIDDDKRVDLDHAGRVEFRAELVNAETRQPIDTVAVPLLASSDHLEVADRAR